MPNRISTGKSNVIVNKDNCPYCGHDKYITFNDGIIKCVKCIGCSKLRGKSGES